MNIRREKLEGGVQDYVKISHSSGWERGNIIMGNGQEEKMWVVGRREVAMSTKAAGNTEFKRVFRIRAIENKFGRFPFISQRKSLAVIEGSTNYIPMKQTVYFHRIVYSDHTGSNLREDVRHPCWLSLPLPFFRPVVQGTPWQSEVVVE